MSRFHTQARTQEGVSYFGSKNAFLEDLEVDYMVVKLFLGPFGRTRLCAFVIPRELEGEMFTRGFNLFVSTPGYRKHGFVCFIVGFNDPQDRNYLPDKIKPVLYFIFVQTA